MDVEGIYRKSGGAGQVNQVKNGFEKSDEYDISDAELDIHAVTSVLKSYLRKLPVPLITFDVYDQFLEAGSKCFYLFRCTAISNPVAEIEDPERKKRAMLDAINEVPKAHRDTLQYLVFHLSRVINRSSENLVRHCHLTLVLLSTNKH